MAHATFARLPEPPSSAPVAFNGAAMAATAPGLVLATLALEPIYLNAAALAILAYPPHSSVSMPDVRASLCRVLRADVCESPVTAPFVSGRRQYLCRTMVLDSRMIGAESRLVALLLERQPREPLRLTEMSRRFRLSPREAETIGHLVHGLTTKEVAQQMRVSPNTVKQFVRIAMSKIGVTTRSGLVGRMLGG